MILLILAFPKRGTWRFCASNINGISLRFYKLKTEKILNAFPDIVSTKKLPLKVFFCQFLQGSKTTFMPYLNCHVLLTTCTCVLSQTRTSNVQLYHLLLNRSHYLCRKSLQCFFSKRKIFNHFCTDNQYNVSLQRISYLKPNSAFFNIIKFSRSC